MIINIKNKIMNLNTIIDEYEKSSPKMDFLRWFSKNLKEIKNIQDNKLNTIKFRRFLSMSDFLNKNTRKLITDDDYTRKEVIDISEKYVKSISFNSVIDNLLTTEELISISILIKEKLNKK